MPISSLLLCSNLRWPFDSRWWGVLVLSLCGLFFVAVARSFSRWRCGRVYRFVFTSLRLTNKLERSAAKTKKKMSIARHLLAPFWIFAERGGFEPPKPFWGLLAFQAGQFNHSCIFPFATANIAQFAKFHNYLCFY